VLPETAAEWFNFFLISSVIFCPIVFISIWFFPAAYGRHKDKSTGIAKKIWGPHINTRLGWFLMEAPSCLLFAGIFFWGEFRFELMPLLFLLMWQFHYFHRTFIFPLRLKVRPGDTMPIGIPVMAILTNSVISFLNASILTWAAISPHYTLEWLTDPRFIIGVLVYFSGYYINKKADRMLGRLRKHGDSSGYSIPQGWLYEKISCPNYFGELVTWTGWAIATWSWPGAIFVLLTAANLVPRAFQNHDWYHEKFPDYPKKRKVIIPYVL